MNEGPQQQRPMGQVSWRSGCAQEPAPHSRVGVTATRVTPSEPQVKRLARGSSHLDHDKALVQGAKRGRCRSPRYSRQGWPPAGARRWALPSARRAAQQPGPAQPGDAQALDSPALQRRRNDMARSDSEENRSVALYWDFENLHAGLVEA